MQGISAGARVQVPAPRGPASGSSNEANNIDVGVLLFGVAALAAAGIILYVCLKEDEKPKKEEPLPQNPPTHLQSPDVCYISGIGSVASAVPISPNELWASPHTVQHLNSYTVTCGASTSRAVAVCPALPSQTGYCSLKTESVLDVISTDTFFKWSCLNVRDRVRISGCPGGLNECYYGVISQLDAKTKQFYILPDFLGSIGSGFSGGKVEVYHNGKYYFIGLVESCSSNNGLSCSSSILVFHPESDFYADPEHDLLLKLQIAVVGDLPNYPKKVSSKRIKYAHKALHQGLTLQHIFTRTAGTLVSIGQEGLFSNPPNPKSINPDGVRIDMQGLIQDGAQNIQIQLNATEGSSSIANVIVPKKYGVYNKESGAEIHLLKRIRFALLESLNTKKTVTFK